MLCARMSVSGKDEQILKGFETIRRACCGSRAEISGICKAFHSSSLPEEDFVVRVTISGQQKQWTLKCPRLSSRLAS